MVTATQLTLAEVVGETVAADFLDLYKALVDFLKDRELDEWEVIPFEEADFGGLASEIMAEKAIRPLEGFGRLRFPVQDYAFPLVRSSRGDSFSAAPVRLEKIILITRMPRVEVVVAARLGSLAEPIYRLLREGKNQGKFPHLYLRVRMRPWTIFLISQEP